VKKLNIDKGMTSPVEKVPYRKPSTAPTPSSTPLTANKGTTMKRLGFVTRKFAVKRKAEEDFKP